jgi:carbon-monoxide dehydrogenase medium subunit
MYAFDYHRPTSLADAKALYAQLEDPMYVSGGMTLIPSMKQRLASPSDLIDLSSLPELGGIEQLNDAQGSMLRVGGLTRHNEVAGNALIQRHLPVLGQVAAAIGDNQVRNRGTLGGSIANADPAADLPAALLAMKASVNTQDRQISADEFFLDAPAGGLREVSTPRFGLCGSRCSGRLLCRWGARWRDRGRPLCLSRLRFRRCIEPPVSAAGR